MSKVKALVVLSGGQDSTTCLAWALAQGYEVHAITFNYGQRHARELQAARDVAVLAGIAERHEVLDIGPILKSTSPLVSAEELETYKDFESMDAIIGDRVEKTFVPMRNALFLTLAANRAVALGATNLVTGVCQADNANYPDCRESFISSQEYTINEALGFNTFDPRYIALVTPLMDMTKAQSIFMMEDLGLLPWLAFSHTAYDGAYPPVGQDHASVLRAHGFEEAGLPDPLIVRAVQAGLMMFPSTNNYGDGTRNTMMFREIQNWAAMLQPTTPQTADEATEARNLLGAA